MPTTPTTSETAPAVEEQFLDLIYGDADLLAAEFDAIIAAEWPEPPSDRPGGSAAGRHPSSGPARRSAASIRGPVSRPRHPGIGGWARQRSPPFPTPDPRQEERQVIATRKPTLTR
jgi:hypothetical protein